MQTILGSGGAIGQPLARELRSYTDKIRLVARNPEKVNPDDETFTADLTDPAQMKAAVKGSEVSYLMVGLPYSLKIWQSQWPVIMENAIEACREAGSKLVFFDNVYMYDASSLNPMTESHAINPPSKKGKVRAAIANRFMDAVSKSEIQGLIARSADFYGPGVKNVSVLTETVFKPFSEGKKANWMGRVDKKHSYTYVPDAAKATALLGNTPDAYGQVWHLPTAPEPFTGKEWINEIALAMDVKPRYRTAGKGMMRILGIFSPIMKELSEMVYQNDRDYVFDSSKFERHFKLKPTPYKTGIRAIVNSDYKK